eukprot:COSAG04_NODE_25374_length_307_cov_1.062201_1_plen_88_part_01
MATTSGRLQLQQMLEPERPPGAGPTSEDPAVAQFLAFTGTEDAAAAGGDVQGAVERFFGGVTPRQEVGGGSLQLQELAARLERAQQML